MIADAPMIDFGSPPHTWGILPELGACAFFYAVHPHIRGEYVFRDTHKLAPVGSPPHTWGIRHFSPVGSVHDRFTPTYVGNTSD